MVLTVICGAACSCAAVFAMTPARRSSGILVCGQVESWSQLAMALYGEPGLGFGVGRIDSSG